MQDIDLEVILFFIGFFYMSLWASRYLWMIHRTYFGVECTTERYGKDSWAIVTGGAGGLGKSAVLQLAEKGFNIIIISNEQDKMDQVEKQINQEFPDRKVEKHVLDFARNYWISDFEQVYSKVQHHDISILVNNVGYFDGNQFTELSENSVHSMITVNCYSVALLTKLVLSSFKRRYKNGKKKSLIVNHCAGATVAPMPYV